MAGSISLKALDVFLRVYQFFASQLLEHLMKYWLPIALVFLVVTINFVHAATDAPEKAAAPLPAWIVSTSPKIGATDVDPNLTEITVTFDRDMSEGMKWKDEEKLVTVDPDKDAHWKDKRTWVLPIKLKRGEYYRIGLDSKNFDSFQSAESQPAPSSTIYFVTRGASKAVQSHTRAPQITKMVPENGATDVDPESKAIRITFNVPMGKGMSWVGGGASFPEGLADEKPKWTSDGRTCILPVTLKPDNQYKLGLNSLQHVNFQSKWGVPLAPVNYEFKTSGDK